MDFALTPDQLHIRDVCRTLAEDFAGRAAEHDRDASSPRKDYEALRDAGLYGLMVPKDLGGWGAGFVGYAIAAEELAQGSPATAMSFNMHCALLGLAFKLPIPEVVKKQIADLVVKEGKLVCGSLSETGHTGRLYASRICSTQLRRTGDGYVLNGRKNFCTMAEAADFIALYAHPTEEADNPGAAILLFLPTGLPGLRIEPAWDTLGMRATRSDTLIMEDCRVPPEAVIEPVVPSLPDLLRDTDPILNNPYTAVYLGIGVGAFRAAIASVKDRVPKGYSQPVAYLPEIRRRVAVMSAQLEAARRLLHYAAWLVDTDAPPAETLAAFLKAKYVVGETVASATRSALEMGGAHATFKGSALERFFRDGATATIMPPPSDFCLNQLGISELDLDPAEVLPTLR